MKNDMSKIGNSMIKFEFKKFNGKENFSSWQKKVKVLLVQQSLTRPSRKNQQNLQVHQMRLGGDESIGGKHNPTMSRIRL